MQPGQLGRFKADDGVKADADAVAEIAALRVQAARRPAHVDAPPLPPGQRPAARFQVQGDAQPVGQVVAPANAQHAQGRLVRPGLLGAHEAVQHFVGRAVAAGRDHALVAGGDRLLGQLGGMPGLPGPDQVERQPVPLQ